MARNVRSAVVRPAQLQGVACMEAHDDVGVLAAVFSGARGSSRHVGVELWHREEAQRLYRAERRGLADELLSRRRAGLSLDDAYRVQWCGVALRVGEGARILGHKVGLTSTAMQQQFGIDEPDSGVLLDYMNVADGGVLRVTGLLSPRVEAELAFRLGTDLRGADVTEEDAGAAVAEVSLALEVIDSRFDVQGVTLMDSVADNAACARFVLGSGVPLSGWDLGGERLTLCMGASEVAAGDGRAVLGDPRRSVAWLARRLNAFGAGLKAGHVVLAGAVHASLPLPRGATLSVSSPSLPPVSLHVA
ncbi:2-keto-4-pentenoate hydratase [Streptomyces sp. NPDC001404]|uniref:2-keto-4-pentenoate hydratase n=1 Tax=Streptomyces sp. NPDC001404 TaxID=3364571 RepID=UPI0036A5C312